MLELLYATGIRRSDPATAHDAMTTKEKLRERINALTEAEAADTLDYLAQRRRGDALGALLDAAPVDNEPTTPEEDGGAREAREQIARGEVFSSEQIKREIT